MNISCKIGFGGKVAGELAVLGAAGGNMDVRDISPDLEGKILVLLFWAPRELLEKAGFVGAVGVVAPSIHFRDFEYFRKTADFPLLVLSKFGKLDASADMAKKLLAVNGKKGSLDGEGKTLTWS